MMGSRAVLTLPALALVWCAACHPSSPRDVHPGAVNESHDIVSWAAFGSSNVTEMGVVCAGRIGLKQGSATIRDRCFTGDTNVVLCTDVTAANPVMCAPGKDLLSIAGTGADVISYARVR